MNGNNLENKKLKSHWIHSFNPLKIAAVSSLGLAVVKIVTFFLTGSLVVLSSFLDSIEDAVISFINTKIQKLSKEKPDKKHPFGHGGIEVLSGLIQASIIFAFGLVIMIEALGRISRSTSFLKEENLINLANGNTMTINEYYNYAVTKISTKAAGHSVTYANLEKSLNTITMEKLSVSGVDMDEETANVIKYQQIYSANVKVLKTIDEMLVTLIDIV